MDFSHRWFGVWATFLWRLFRQMKEKEGRVSSPLLMYSFEPHQTEWRYSQCLKTFLNLTISGETCFPEQPQTMLKLAELTAASATAFSSSYILNVSMAEETLQTDIWIHNCIHLPRWLVSEEVMFLLCAVIPSLYFKHSPTIHSFIQDNHQFASSSGQLLITVINLHFFRFLGQMINLWNPVITHARVSAEYSCG